MAELAILHALDHDVARWHYHDHTQFDTEHDWEFLMNHAENTKIAITSEQLNSYTEKQYDLFFKMFCDFLPPTKIPGSAPDIW